MSIAPTSKPTTEEPSGGDSTSSGPSSLPSRLLDFHSNQKSSKIKKQGCQTKDEFDRAKKKREEQNQRKRERYAMSRNQRNLKKIESISANPNELKDLPPIEQGNQQLPIEPKMETEDFFLSNSFDVKKDSLKMKRKRGCSTEEKSEGEVLKKIPTNDNEGMSEETEGASMAVADKFSCGLCSKVFKNNTGLASHVLSCGPKYLPFSCHLCQGGFRTREKLDNHMEYQHTMIKCEYPDCNFKCTRSNLSKHIDRQHLKRFKCDHCDHACGTISHLRLHIETHTGEKRFKCQWCDYRSNQKSNTSNHEKLYCKYRKVAM